MVRSIADKGHFVDYLTTRVSRYAHHFCGPHDLRGATCPNCQKPLLRFLILDVTDERVGVTRQHLKTLSLLFCWTCELAQGPFFYRQVDESGVELLNYKRGGVTADFPYEGYPPFFPGHSIELVPIPSSTQQVIRDLNAGKGIDTFHHETRDIARPRHQVGGEPYLVQAELEPLQCPACNQAMPFLAAIGDECLDPRGFTGNDYVQVIYSYCQKCLVVGAYQQAD